MMKLDKQTTPNGLSLLDPMDYHKVVPWFDALDLAAIQLDALRESGDGKVFVDDPANPQACWMLGDECYGYFAGNADAAGFADAVLAYLMKQVLPARAPGDRQVILFSTSVGWQTLLDQKLGERGGFRIRRHNFAFEAAAFQNATAALPPLPEGYALRTLAEGKPDAGVFCGGELVSRCYAGFTGLAMAEIGVDTAEAHRCKGLALHTCSQFIRNCLAAGLTPHWSCWDYNTPSVNLALRLGFLQLPDIEVNFCDLG